jgi:hypothetical protein
MSTCEKGLTGVGRMAQVVEHLPRNHEALSSNANTTPLQKKERKGKGSTKTSPHPSKYQKTKINMQKKKKAT